MSREEPAYKLVEICAAGTFGTVCVVRDLTTGELLAVKVLKQHHLSRPRVIARTRDEAAMMAQLDHPGIVRVRRLLSMADRPVLTMEWVRGLSLESVLEAAPKGLPIAETVEILRLATEALEAAYHALPAKGGAPMQIIHRDVKPSNMLLSVDGELKVMDFGIARAQFDGKEAKTLSMVLGARGYLAPERLDGHDDRPSCDVYSLGIMAHELVTGRHIALSVHRDYHAQALRRHLKSLCPPGMDDAGIDLLRALIAQMCSYDEADRPNYPEITARLDEIAARAQQRPDLRRWARRYLLPTFRARPRVPPPDHPAYPGLAFLERGAHTVAKPAPPDVDERVRALLRAPEWWEDLDELQLLQVKNPHWSARPFLELLPETQRRWWRFWGRDRSSAAEAITILGVLRDRRTEEVYTRIRALRAHEDPQISGAARRWLARP